MNKKNISFQTTDWSNIPKTEHKGETGTHYRQTVQSAPGRLPQKMFHDRQEHL